MDSKLIIKMFGEFSITNDHHSLVATTASSMQIIVLLSYLISSRDTEVPKQKLMEILWPNEESNNPAGALRNLIYRARKEISRFFPEDAPECIILTRNSYFWNRKIPCQVDIFDFERFFTLSQKEENPELRFLYLQSMIPHYTGMFLPLQSSDEWVMYRSAYYSRIFNKAIFYMIEYLKSLAKFQEVLDLCNTVIAVEQTDETIHKEKLLAMLKLGEIQPALDYYHMITDFYSKKYGIDVSNSFSDLYNELLHSLPNSNQSILSLENSLKESTSSQGSFYCNFDVFKIIYQINLRSAKRSEDCRYLVLLTLYDTNMNEVFTADIREEMELLNGILSTNLRTNDVFTQSSVSQMSLILTVTNKKGCQTAIKRIMHRFERKKQHPNINVHIDTRQII